MKITQLSLFDDVPAKEYDTAGGEEYAAFVEKFKPKKTTDDCYTPPAVCDAVVGWLRSEGFIGNAVEVNMARVLCEALCKKLNQKKQAV